MLKEKLKLLLAKTAAAAIREYIVNTSGPYNMPDERAIKNIIWSVTNDNMKYYTDQYTEEDTK